MKRFLLEYLPAWLLLVVFGLIVLHAPITVWVGAHIPGLALAVKAWKELAMLLAAALVGVALWRTGRLNNFCRRPIAVVALIYAALHVFMIGFYGGSLQPVVAGLMIDLRYIIYFLLVLGFLSLYPAYKVSFIRVATLGAGIVVGFAVMQLFLPKDALAMLGYGPDTIQPYLTVDQNPDYIRFSSTLRGPNPLGAYAVIVLAGLVALGVKYWKKASMGRRLPYLALAAAALVALWVSYSRSALLAGLVAIFVVLITSYYKIIQRQHWLGLLAGLIVCAGIVMASAGNSFVKNVVLHDSPTTGAAIDSNGAHAESLASGMARMAVQPLGAGIGSTGSASLLGGNGLIVENQYLMIAHEIGWAGLMLFVLLYGLIIKSLWQRRGDWLALSVAASGLGLAVVGLFLPVWADDTVSIVWWGLAAIALTGGSYERTTNKKTA